MAQSFSQARPVPTDMATLRAVQADTRKYASDDPAEMAERAFWMQFRRALLLMVDCIEEYQRFPSVVEQHEARKAKQQP
ncbi:MAG TPA: hypothetical protein VGP33_14465 [Chloroflexota bacterium]|jgi:hypothetical protein|nr:hypothetical protein [Chloroflexota bacterium]